MPFCHCFSFRLFPFPPRSPPPPPPPPSPDSQCPTAALLPLPVFCGSGAAQPPLQTRIQQPRREQNEPKPRKFPKSSMSGRRRALFVCFPSADAEQCQKKPPPRNPYLLLCVCLVCLSVCSAPSLGRCGESWRGSQGSIGVFPPHHPPPAPLPPLHSITISHFQS